jgi:hypothetical protein
MLKSNKGKKATRGEKQILEENVETINFYFYMYASSNLAYLALTYFLFWESFTTKFVLLYSLTAFVSSIAYYFITYMGKPIRDESGAIIGAGSDLNMEGHISEYAKDAIIFSVIVLALSLISSYFWLALIVVPVYVFYLLWKNFLGPWFFAPAPEEDPAQDQKKVKEKRKIIRR